MSKVSSMGTCMTCKGNGKCCTNEEIEKIMDQDARTGNQTAIQLCPTCKGSGVTNEGI